MSRPEAVAPGGSTLALMPIARPAIPDLDRRRTKYLPRLGEPQQQWEFIVNGSPLHSLLQRVEVPEPELYGFREPFNFVSVVDTLWPDEAAAHLRRLVGDLPRDEEYWPLEPGRLPLYCCPLDQDLGCGAVTVAVTHGSDEVTWHDFRIEDLWPGKNELDLSALGPFTFPRTLYRGALLEHVGTLEALDAEDRAAELAYRSARSIRGRWRRLLRR